MWLSVFTFLLTPQRIRKIYFEERFQVTLPPGVWGRRYKMGQIVGTLKFLGGKTGEGDALEV